MSTTVGVYIWPNMTMLDSLIPHQVLGLMSGLEVFSFARTTEPFLTDSGMKLVADYDLSDMPQPDILVVGGGANPLPEMADPTVVESIRKAGAGAEYVTSVCTGSLILAEAGLLDGYRATAHWAYKDILRRYELVEVVDGRVVEDRTRITGGGVTAGMDFAITLIAKVLGEDTARATELMFEYQPEPPYCTGSPDTAPPPLVDHVRSLLHGMAPGLEEFVTDRNC